MLPIVWPSPTKWAPWPISICFHLAAAAAAIVVSFAGECLTLPIWIAKISHSNCNEIYLPGRTKCWISMQLSWKEMRTKTFQQRLSQLEYLKLLIEVHLIKWNALSLAFYDAWCYRFLTSAFLLPSLDRKLNENTLSNRKMLFLDVLHQLFKVGVYLCFQHHVIWKSDCFILNILNVDIHVKPAPKSTLVHFIFWNFT